MEGLIREVEEKEATRLLKQVTRQEEIIIKLQEQLIMLEKLEKAKKIRKKQKRVQLKREYKKKEEE